MMIKGFCFSGPCGAGKTTAAQMVSALTGWKKVSEGLLLKHITSLLTGDYADRRTLQLIGEGIRGLLGVDVWLEAALRPEGGQPLIFDDIRHPEDLEILKSMGYFTVWIDADILHRIERMWERDNDEPDVVAIDAPSEHLLDTAAFHYRLTNNGTKDDLRRAIRAMIIEAPILLEG